MKLQFSPTLLISQNPQRVLSEAERQGITVISGDTDRIVSSLMSLKEALRIRPCVVGDISPLVAGHSIENRLLTVLEAFKPQAIFVSSVDCFSQILLSRFAAIRKEISYIPNVGNFKADMVDILSQGGRADMEFVLKQCPGYLPFYVQLKTSRLPVKERLLDVLRIAGE